MGAMGRIVGPNAVAFERLLDASVAVVWDHLTRPELLTGWLAAAKFEPRLGGAVHFQFEGEKGESGTVTRWEPPAVLAYTWNEGGATSHVTFELEPRGENVLLRLTHEKLPSKDLGDFGAGWHAHLDALEGQLTIGRRQTRAEHLQAYSHVRPAYSESFEEP